MDSMYIILVNRIPGIRDRYKKKRSHSRGTVGRIGAWIYLLWLNIEYYVFRNRKLQAAVRYPYYEEKSLYAKGSESSLSKRKSPKVFAEELSKYDVVSFDVFDTLIFRPFSEPTDLFFLLGNQLEYMDFKRIRCEMEWKAREKKYKKDKSYEVTLDDIYEVLSEQTGIKKKEAMEAEFALECEFCFANPYMKQVVSHLKAKGKRIIITSDMYLNTEQIKTLLQTCGYEDFVTYYVSCDLRKSKNEGNLYDYIRSQEGTDKSYAHVGDNYISDVERAKDHKFVPFHYVNVNVAGEPFRPYDMSVITGGIYRGLVNSHIHNGLNSYSREYEYGYIYGGLFVTGYCQFIHQYVKEQDIDKILFLARDGDVLSKAYQILYPEESENWEYVYWSRLAALKLSARYYKYDYFRRFLYHKVNQNYTLEQIFSSMELTDMLPELCAQKGITQETKLTDKNVEKIKRYLMKYWEAVLEHYKDQLEAGKQYYEKILKGCKSAVAVDIGWAGSGAVTLDYVVNKEWNLNCRITGIVAGTNSCHNAEPDTSETFLQSGWMASYMYSQRENRDIWKLHDAGKGHNLYWELLLDAPMGSFKGFYLDENGQCECRFKEPKADVQKIGEIQNGILDFVKQYGGLREKVGGLERIGGRDAYAPVVNVEQKMNSEFAKNIMSLADDANVE